MQRCNSNAVIFSGSGGYIYIYLFIYIYQCIYHLIESTLFHPLQHVTFYWRNLGEDNRVKKKRASWGLQTCSSRTLYEITTLTVSLLVVFPYWLILYNFTVLQNKWHCYLYSTNSWAHIFHIIVCFHM